MHPVSIAVILLSLCCLFPCYRTVHDDIDENSFNEMGKDRNGRSFSVEEENEVFVSSGICSSENRSQLHTCSHDATSSVRTLQQLKETSCYCDYSCHAYGDCCIDRIGTFDYDGERLSCRNVKSPNSYSIPIYVKQQCPNDWKDILMKQLCEIEAVERQKMGLSYDHRQDLPVLSESSRIFYRNVYCAICNKDTNLVKWDTFLYCNGFSNATRIGFEDTPDFSSAIYVPRTMNYRRVKVDGVARNCNLIVRNFDLKRLVVEYGGRLCKSVIDTCPRDSDVEVMRKCKLYSSYVYQTSYTAEKRKVYKNFHCAKCHHVPIKDLSCDDSYSPFLFSPPWRGKLGLSMLFDFNFQGDGDVSSCLLSDGQMWDPIFRECQNVTCGALFLRQGGKCIPLTSPATKQGLKKDCLKKILNKNAFTVLQDGRVYVNYSQKTITSDEFEIFGNDSGDSFRIAICLDNEYQLLPISKVHYWLSVITLSVSIIFLILHLAIYGMFKTLRNCPGKNLMSLASSLLCGHFFLLSGPHFTDIYWLCYFSSVATHFGYLAAFSWMSVMAYDIYKTFSVTQTRRATKNKIFINYSIYAWLSSSGVVILSIIIDNLLSDKNKFRPRYGEPICWFNHRYGLLLFFTVPVSVLLLANVILFLRTAFLIRKISQQTKMVNNFSDKVRYFLYLKLTVVFGLSWTLGFVAGITRMDVFWYPFIILNGLQGALIFLAFSVKRNVLNMLAVKFRIRSSKYRMGRRTGLKAAMYNSLSNISSLQNTFSTQLSTRSENKEMLKAVRKINPDVIVEKKHIK